MLKNIIPGLIILILFVFNQTIDPLLANLIQENDLHELIDENEDEFMIQRVRKAKKTLILLLPLGISDYSVYYLMLVLILFVYALKKDYWSLRQKIKKQISQLKFQFPIWLRQLQILLQTNTVIKSLSLSLPSAPVLIQEDLKKLVEEIEKDALNLTPYLHFLKMYHLSEVERAMKLLYRYNTVGKEDAYLQFNRMIQTTTKWLRSERSQRNETRLMAFQWIGMAPLFGVTVLFMAIMFEILMRMFNNGF